ncbi:protein arv1 homolog isoform X3 [Eutrema salsugineum]|uniref:protein arv1 homolog isoform X3 n=1 Tax=Eutrema salsugineum TaxID=72664 RepID=UPI000CED47BD|nr:protein arv1 homolog isoform X3 [Eutrema salsugineum]
MAREKKCVECGHKVKSLFIQYSPGNFRLMKCENCKEVADEYIECELMIIFIDLILHKTKAYRHLLYNGVTQETLNVQHLLWKLVLAYLLLDTYRSLLLRRTNVDDSSVSMCLASLEILVNVLSTNFAFVLSFALAAKIMLVMSVDASRKEILLGILISSYVKIFLFAMPVWDIPVSVIFIVDMLVLTSNAVALKVMTDSTTSRCLAACFMAHSIRFLADQISGSRSLKHLGSVM